MFIIVWASHMIQEPKSHVGVSHARALHCPIVGVCAAQGTPVSGSDLDTGPTLSDLQYVQRTILKSS